MLFSCAAWAQSSAGVPDATLNIEGFVLDEPCSPKLALSKQLVTPYVINLSSLNSRILLTDALGPVSKFSLNVDQRKTNPDARCVGADFGSLPLKLVFDSDLAAIAPRTGLLRNSASNRPAQNVFVQASKRKNRPHPSRICPTHRHARSHTAGLGTRSIYATGWCVVPASAHHQAPRAVTRVECGLKG